MHCGNGVKQLKMDNVRNYYCMHNDRKMYKLRINCEQLY